MKREKTPSNTCPKLPSQGQPGRSRNQFPPRAHSLHTDNECRWAKATGWKYSLGLGSTRAACGSQTPAQPPAFPPQDPGQWVGEGGVILYPSYQPPELLCWEDP